VNATLESVICCCQYLKTNNSVVHKHFLAKFGRIKWELIQRLSTLIYCISFQQIAAQRLGVYFLYNTV